MRKLVYITILVILVPVLGKAQNSNTVTIRFAAPPTGACSPFTFGIDNSTGNFYDCNSAAWLLVGPSGGGGSGTVTSFSAGTLSPVFTTSVATATTTPALTFTLSNASAHNFLGNNTGSTGAPAYVRPACADLSNAAPSCSTDTTNASNITAGTLPVAQLPSSVATYQIAQIVVVTPANTETFSTIPGTYTNLEVIGNGAVSDSALSEGIGIQFNSDSGSHYDYQAVQAINTAASGFATATTTTGFLSNFPGATASASEASSFVANIPSYANTSFFKQVISSWSRFETTGTLSTYNTGQAVSQWRSTSAITSITLNDAGGGNFVAGTTFTLYGVK